MRKPRAAKKEPYPVVRVESWQQFRDLVDGERFRSWGFRGQSDAAWPLLSALSRHLRYAGLHRDAWAPQEERILRIFQRKAHLFLDHIPTGGDTFQWLALMQHHGSPTRLLDVTWSPYVALFFAIERSASVAAVWAINAPELDRDIVLLKNKKRLDLSHVGTWDDFSYERYFLDATDPFVIIGEPKVMNRRLIAQSGTFIIPSLIDRPVEEIVSEYKNPERYIVKIEIDAARLRTEGMRALYSMNITQSTLFPDLDGLARSMAYELEYHWAFDPRTLQPNAGFPPPQELGFCRLSRLPDDQ